MEATIIISLKTTMPSMCQNASGSTLQISPKSIKYALKNSHASSMNRYWSFSEDIITSKVKRTLLIPSHTTCEFWTSRKCSGLMKLTYRVNILLAGSDTQLPLHRHLCSSLEAFTIPSACSATLYAGETSMTFGAWTFKIFKHSPGSALKPRENRPLLVTATP